MEQVGDTRSHSRKQATEQGRLSPRRPGRPLKKRSQLKSAQKGFILEQLRRHHADSQKKMEEENDKLSALEKLPTELIHHIFFIALEVNLPRTSDHLRRVLSTNAIYDALVAFAYFDDDGLHPVETKHFLPAEYRYLDCEEKIRLQRDILSCRWCTLDRIQACMSSLSRLAMVQAWHAENLEEKRVGEETDMGNPIVSNEVIRSIAPLPQLVDEEKLERHFLARDTTDILGNSNTVHETHTHPFLPRIVTWSVSLDEQKQAHKGTHRSISILATRYIPSWLLRDVTKSEDELVLLRLLRQGYTFIQNDNVLEISAQAVFDGMRSAIYKRNTVALKTLLEMHNAFFKSGAWTIQTMMSSQLTPPSHHPLPLDLFHQAVRQEQLSTELLSLLLRAGIDSLPRDDELVTAWAVHEAQHGNAVAVWLLKHMEGTGNYGLPRRGHLFVDGCLSWRVRAREQFPFEETLFSQELGYIAGTTTIVPAGPHGTICGSAPD